MGIIYFSGAGWRWADSSGNWGAWEGPDPDRVPYDAAQLYHYRHGEPVRVYDRHRLTWIEYRGPSSWSFVNERAARDPGRLQQGAND